MDSSIFSAHSSFKFETAHNFIIISYFFLLISAVPKEAERLDDPKLADGEADDEDNEKVPDEKRSLLSDKLLESGAVVVVVVVVVV